MYSPGEIFYYDNLGLEFETLFNLTYDNEDYLIAENEDGDKYVFKVSEDEDEIELVEDEDLSDEIMEYWEEEYMDKADIGDWDDDEYYDREDHVNVDDEFEDYNEDEDY